MDSVSVSALLSTLTDGFHGLATSLISSAASFFGSELLKLGIEEIQNIAASLKHFIGNLTTGMGWGEAMANMLTELWNETKSALAQLVTDFVNAVGKLFQNAGLVPA
jgi:hypothetical protein